MALESTSEFTLSLNAYKCPVLGWWKIWKHLWVGKMLSSAADGSWRDCPRLVLRGGYVWGNTDSAAKQVCLPDTQQAKLRCRGLQQRVYSPGNQVRKWENKSQICLPKGEGLKITNEFKKQGGLRRGERWLEIRKRWGNRHSAQGPLSYRLLHGMHV